MTYIYFLLPPALHDDLLLLELSYPAGMRTQTHNTQLNLLITLLLLLQPRCEHHCPPLSDVLTCGPYSDRVPSKRVVEVAAHHHCCPRSLHDSSRLSCPTSTRSLITQWQPTHDWHAPIHPQIQQHRHRLRHHPSKPGRNRTPWAGWMGPRMRAAEMGRRGRKTVASN